MISAGKKGRRNRLEGGSRTTLKSDPNIPTIDIFLIILSRLNSENADSITKSPTRGEIKSSKGKVTTKGSRRIFFKICQTEINDWGRTGLNKG